MSMRTRRPTLVTTLIIIGLLSGLAFVAHASFAPASLWPYVWPLIGGAALVAATRRARMDWKQTANLGLRAGGLAAVVIVAIGIPASWIGASMTFTDTAAVDATGTFATLAFAMLVVAAICAALEVVGALLAHPFRAHG